MRINMSVELNIKDDGDLFIDISKHQKMTGLSISVANEYNYR